MRFLIGPVLLSCLATATAQAFVLPQPGPLVGNTNLPLSAGVGHYQQWHSANQLGGVLSEPVRFERMRFLAGTTQTGITTSIDLEVQLGHGSPTGLTGLFAMNFADPPVTVFPRATVTLSAGAAGAPVLTIPFTQLWTWDGVRPLVYDIKVYGNGQGSVLFNYNFRMTPQGGFGLQRLYTGGNANATSGSVQPGQGLFTEFLVRPGVTLPYGDGCPGPNFIDPVASVSQVPSPGIIWTHTISQASPQRLCALVLGDSDAMWGADPLPFDLGPVIGANGCFLLTNPLANVFTMTVGGAGAGSANLGLNLPPITEYVGLSFYTQWLVLDPSAVNGVLSATGGIRSIVAPVGG